MKTTSITIFFFGIIIFLTGVAGIWIYGDIAKERKILVAREDLKRLGKISQLVSQKNFAKDPKNFWESIGMSSPMLDPWGNPYSDRTIEKAGTQVSGWATAGPDGIVGNADDIFQPYFKVESYDLTRPDLHVPENATTAR